MIKKEEASILSPTDEFKPDDSFEFNSQLNDSDVVNDMFQTTETDEIDNFIQTEIKEMNKKGNRVPSIDLGNIQKYQDDFEQIADVEGKTN